MKSSRENGARWKEIFKPSRFVAVPIYLNEPDNHIRDLKNTGQDRKAKMRNWRKMGPGGGSETFHAREEKDDGLSVCLIDEAR